MTRPLVLVESSGDAPVARLLGALGVDFERLSLAAAATASSPSGTTDASLVLSEDDLARAAGADQDHTLLHALVSRYRRALVYPFSGTSAGLRALSGLVAGAVDAASNETVSGSPYSVSQNFAAAGPFAGLQAGRVDASTDRGLIVRDSPYAVEQIVSVDGRGLLTRVVLPRTELFVLCSTRVFDVDAEIVKNLDGRECFPGLVPLLFFLRHAGATFWTTPCITANLMVDDLNLRPSYGFVDLRQLAAHVDQLGHAVSVAFIPWNYNRTSSDVTELFRQRWPRLSVSVHGCDHVGAEFTAASAAAARPLIDLGFDRMRLLEATTGVRFDRVMAFPQSKFSAQAMEAFRHSRFLAAVSTQLVDDRSGRGVRAADLLAPAITSYAGFPLFLRRTAVEPLENFALDLLLGKPCLIVTHHDDFKYGMERIGSLVRSINALEPRLSWTNLEDIVARTYSVRSSETPASTEVRLYSALTTLDTERVPPEITLSKREPLEDAEFQFFVDGEPLPNRREGVDLTCRVARPIATPSVVEVRPLRVPTPSVSVQPLSYRTRVRARRYLSEIRDNYVARSSWATAAVRSTRQLLKGPSR